MMLSVLIVDDEPFVRQGIRMIIDWESYGYQITGEAQSALEAIELLKENTYDVIMVDIKMPKMNGLEFIEYVKINITKKVKFIILSGFYEFKYAQQAIRCHVNNYLLKPIQPEELIVTLQSIKVEIERQKKFERSKKEKDKLAIDYYLNSIVASKANGAMNDDLLHLLGDKGEYQYLYVEFDEQEDEWSHLTEEEKKAQVWQTVRRLQLKYEQVSNYIFCNLAKSDGISSIGVVVTPLFYKYLNCQESEFLESLKEALKEISPYRMIYSMGSKVDRIEELIQSYEKAYFAKSRKGNDTVNNLLLQIEQEVNEHYMEELSLKTLSEKYFMNSAYLGQLFKKEYGVFFKDYLNSVRIKKAAKLLLQSNRKIYQIAKDVGYNNTDHFINTFTKEMGVTPSRYRKLGESSKD